MGGFIGGQLNSVAGLTLPQVFYAIGVTVSALVILARIGFAVWGKKSEAQLVARRQYILKSIEASKTMADGSTNKPGCSNALSSAL